MRSVKFCVTIDIAMSFPVICFAFEYRYYYRDIFRE